MIETGESPPPWSVAELQGLRAELVDNVTPEDDAAGCLAQLEALEALKSTVAAAQVRATQAFAVLESARLEELAATSRATGGRRVPAAAAAVGAQVGLARRESPARGRMLAQAAAALVEDLPHTLAALGRGVLNEERALLVVRETQDLGAADRRRLDEELAHGHPHDADDAGRLDPDRPEGGTGDGVGGMGTEALRRWVQRLVLRFDAQAATRRYDRARARRHVSGRLLSDGTGRITAVVKAEHYTAVMDALGAAAATARNDGDPRTSDQVRADTLVQRVTGHDPATTPKVELHLVLPATTLLGTPGVPAEPGWVPGGGHVPAGVCRQLFLDAAEADLAAVRRVFADPADGRLVAMESTNRAFVGLLARMIKIRDGGTCRTPWCDAPIKHSDHVVPDAEGGPTALDNAQGLCEACNQVKETPGFTSWVGPAGGTHLTTPHGGRYVSRHTPLAC